MSGVVFRSVCLNMKAVSPLLSGEALSCQVDRPRLAFYPSGTKLLCRQLFSYLVVAFFTPLCPWRLGRPAQRKGWSLFCFEVFTLEVFCAVRRGGGAGQPERERVWAGRLKEEAFHPPPKKKHWHGLKKKVRD